MKIEIVMENNHWWVVVETPKVRHYVKSFETLLKAVLGVPEAYIEYLEMKTRPRKR